MNFSVPDPGGVGAGAPAMVLLRGSDPLIEIPPALHLFRRIQGLTFQVGLPRGLAPLANAVPLSEIACVYMGASLAQLRLHGFHETCRTCITPAGFIRIFKE